MVKHWLVIALSLLTAGAVAGCSAVEQTKREQAGLATLPSRSELIITNGNGSVTVQTHTQPGLKVITEKKVRTADTTRAGELLEKTEVLLSQYSAQARVQAVVPVLYMGESVSTAMQVWVPAGYAGRLTISTGNGQIRVYNLDGEGHFTTGNGDVQINGWEGSLSVRTSNGKITAQSARLTASSDFGTSNGAIDLTLAAIGAGLVATTLNGSIHVALPPDTNSDLSATAVNGTINVVSSGRTTQARGSFSVAGTGPKVTLQTANGPITVEGL